MSNEKKQEKTKSTLRRLLWANLIAAALLLAITVSVLSALGLLSSMIEFFF